MDVWFDSGSSWAAVCELRSELKYPADLYLGAQINIEDGSSLLC